MSEMSEPGGPSPLGLDPVRLSDSERDEGVRRLERACVEGRLTLGEFGARVEIALAARTHGDLAPLLADLPPVAAAAPTAGVQPAPTAGVQPALTPGRARFSMSILGGHYRHGRWSLPSHLVHVALLAGISYDLSEAELCGPRSALTVVSLLGGVRLRVPEAVRVEVDGFSFLGGRQVDDGAFLPPPDAPLVHLRVISILGGVHVTRGGRSVTHPWDFGHRRIPSD
jgi:hypothetical protein